MVKAGTAIASILADRRARDGATQCRPVRLTFLVFRWGEEAELTTCLTTVLRPATQREWGCLSPGLTFAYLGKPGRWGAWSLAKKCK